jgi:ketosteroid isomerase-like protein
MTGRADEVDVRAAVDHLVRAFGQGDLVGYFRAFHPDASFVFHTTPRRLDGVDAYQAEWNRWSVEDGFVVLGCRSSDARVQVWGDVAVVAHLVETRTRTHAGIATVRERETIVLQRQPDGRWLAVHEHLSLAPV